MYRQTLLFTPQLNQNQTNSATMNKRLLFCMTSLCLLVLGLAHSNEELKQSPLDAIHFDQLGLSKVLEQLGQKPQHLPNSNIEGVSAQKGKEIVFTGQTTNAQGQANPPHSKYFVCTSCHNTVKEVDNLLDVNPQSRIDYAAKRHIPLLPAASFYGIVNRNTFYNDDYQQKYGHVPAIAQAKHDIRQAIQLCATECSQGRPMENWEIESVLAYFWTIQLKMGDLALSFDEKRQIQQALNDKEQDPELVQLIQSRYLQAFPATFSQAPNYKKLSKEELKDEKRYRNGKLIYDLSCQHCHANKRHSHIDLSNKDESFVYLHEQMKKKAPHAMFSAIRNGVKHQQDLAYMPQYTLEHLSDEHLIDLQIYVENRATLGGIKDQSGKLIEGGCGSKQVSYADVQNLIETKCSGCHNSILGPDFTSYETMKSSLLSGTFALRVFERQDMPLGDVLSPEELHILQCWKEGNYSH